MAKSTPTKTESGKSVVELQTEAIEARTDNKITQLRGEVREGFANMRTDLANMKYWYIATYVASMITVIGILRFF